MAVTEFRHSSRLTNASPELKNSLRQIEDDTYKLRRQINTLMSQMDQRSLKASMTADLLYIENLLFPAGAVAAEMPQEYGVIPFFYETDAGTGSNAVDTLCVFPLQLTNQITIDSATIAITTARANSFQSVGFYDSHKNLKATAKFDSSTTGQKVATFTSVTLTPGFYWVGSCNGGNAAAPVFERGFITANTNLFINNSVTIMGTAGATSGGDLPSSFTTITSAAIAIPQVRFYAASLGG